MIRALYVDDEEALLEVAKAFLEQPGELQIDTFLSVQGAEKELIHNRYDVIISDYQMPEMNGIDFLKKLRSNGSKIPFILFTGRGREEVVIEALNSGADFYLQKGGDPKSLFVELGHKVRVAVERNRKETVLKESEEKFRAIVDSSPAAMHFYRLDPDNRLIFTGANPAADRIIGISHHDLLGKTIEEAFPNLADTATPQMYRDVALGNIGLQRFEIVYREERFKGCYEVSVFKTGPRTIAVDFVEISERKKVEEALRQKTALFEAQTSASQDGILVIDENLKRILVNQRIVELYDVPQYIMDNEDDTLLLNHVASLTKYPERFLEKVEYLNSHIHETSRDELEFKSGMILERYSAPVIGKDGKYYGRTWTFHDITERKKTEMALRESEQLYRTLFEKSPFPITLNDRNHRFVDVNERHLQIYDQAREEIIGKTPVELNYTNSEEAGKMNAALAENGGALDNYHMMVKTSNGNPLHMIASFRLIQFRGEPHLLSIMNDVTDLLNVKKDLQVKIEELDQERNKLQIIADQIPSALYQILIEPDGSMRFLFVSKGIEDLAHAPSEKFLTGGDWWWKLAIPEDVEKLTISINEAVEKRSRWEHEFRVVDLEGKMKWILGTALPSYDHGHQATVWIGTLTDITERKRIEEALRHANMQLSLLNEMTRHDMLNQLSILSGYTALLESSDSSSNRSELVGKIEKSTAILRDQIGFTRQYQEIGANSPKWQNLHDLVQKAQQDIIMNGLKVEEENTEISILADPMLEKVVHNLIDNVLRHSGGAGRLSIKAFERSGELILTFEDDGKGITQEEKAHLFQHGHGKNTGFGLFLSREILSISGISILENSEPGKGARFEITIPAGEWRSR